MQNPRSRQTPIFYCYAEVICWKEHMVLLLVSGGKKKKAYV